MSNIKTALSQVSQPARGYYYSTVPFCLGYNLAYGATPDYERFKKDLDNIFELANAGLITWVEVKFVHDDDEYTENREDLAAPARSRNMGKNLPADCNALSKRGRSLGKKLSRICKSFYRAFFCGGR